MYSASRRFFLGILVSGQTRKSSNSFRGLLALLAGALFLIGSTSRGSAAELLMFEHAGCPWCAKWDREIGPVYARTDEGKLAPLRRLPLSPPPAGVRLAAPVNATPTFVLVKSGREIGRITGYNNEESFWALLTILLANLLQASPDQPAR
jgi:hypothetical protein